MTPEQFTYWLQGYVEITGGNNGLTDDQWKMIKDHLATVFHKVTPGIPGSSGTGGVNVPYYPLVQPYFDEKRGPLEPPYKIIC